MAKTGRDLFTGRSGQLAVMAEFLIRETNVAIPEVDIGDDILVVRDDHDRITRVQVKTANARASKQAGKFDAQFSVKIEQLEAGPANLVYVFVVRHNDRWEEFVIVPRLVLNQLRTVYGALSGVANNQTLRLTFTSEKVMYKKFNFQPFRSRFDPWPPLDEIPAGVLPRDSQ